jgi:hypothetical protein
MLTFKPTGDQLRDQGIEARTENDAAFMVAIRNTIESMPFLLQVTSEDIRLAHFERGGIPPNHYNSWGAAIRTATKAGLLEPTESYRKASRSSAHSRALRVYVLPE